MPGSFMPSKKLQAGKLTYTVYRLYKAFLVCFKYSKKVFRYAIKSKETATFTYNLKPENESYLINLTAIITNSSIKTVQYFFDELRSNDQLREEILLAIGKSSFKMKKDKRCDYGSKLSFYAIIRILKPKVVVENGMEMGFTSIVLCEAIRKNKEEGYEGKFIGLDINPDAGYLVKISNQFEGCFEMKYGDSIASLASLKNKIDFYFSDGLRTYEYEQNEFSCLEMILNDAAIVITNKASFSKALYELSQRRNAKFSFFKEQPLDHWYEGSGLGVMHI